MPVIDYCDVIVIGSGPVGSAFARTIAERRPTARIVMVELGPKLTPRPGCHVKNIAADDDRAAAREASQGIAGEEASADNPDRPVARPGTHLADPRRANSMPAAALSTCVGGMGAHWTCACPRPGDSERIPFIASEEFDAALDAAQQLLEVTTTAFPESRQGRAIERSLGRVYDPGRAEGRQVQIMPLACHARPDGGLSWTGGDTVLGPLINPGDPLAKRFELRWNTLCAEILHYDGIATGARLLDRETGEESVVRAKAVVVAADALRTPQILWASGIRPAALGRYLNDQPQVLSAVTLNDEHLGLVADAADLPLVQRSHRSPVDATTAVYWLPFADGVHPYHGQIMHLDVSPIGINADVDPKDSPGIVALGWFCRKVDIRAEDRVRFDDADRDAYGMPAIRIDYALTENDLAEVERAREEQLRVAGVLGTLLPGDTSRLLPAGSSLHYQGSTRMGARDDGTSVCDDRSQVWGYRNLFVGGNGVIPTATACNPTLTSVALAVRACDAVIRLLDED